MKNLSFFFLLVLAFATPLSAFADDAAGSSKSAPKIDALKNMAKEGDAHAQWRLGVALDQGEETTSDPVAAVFWFRKAIENGSASAHASLALMYAMGRGVPVDYNASMEHYLTAARLGEPHGFFGVGVLFANGEGVSQNYAEAFSWMIAATVAGDQQAIDLINSGAFPNDFDMEMVRGRVTQIAGDFDLDISNLQFHITDLQH